ncbi:MAG: ABC transporter ATP-binding protein [Actinomycetota bacterium]
MINRLLRVTSDEGPLRRCVAWFVFVAVLQGIGFALLVPILRALIEGDTSTAWAWAAGLVGLLAVYAVVLYVAQMTAFLAAIGISRSLFERLGDRIAQLPLGWFDTDQIGPVGRLTSKGVIDVMGVPAHLLRPIINAFVTPVTVVVIMAAFDWRLALAAAASAPIAWLVFRWAGSLVERAEHATHEAAADAGSRLVEFAQTQAVLRSYGRTVDGHALLDDALVQHRNASRRLLTTAVPGLIGFIAVVQVAFTMILVVGVALATGESTDGAELIALLALAVRFVEPMVAAADIGGGLKIANNALNRADELLATPVLPEPDTSATPADASIALTGVSFGYDERPVIEDLSLSIPHGTMTAVVGPSGSGKTTIARLVARFWDTDEGTVEIGGVDVRSMTGEDLMANVSIVFQETYLFAGTIAENLRLARPDATDADLERVAELARLDEVLRRLPDGWESDVGERGDRLSGGERQRVSIARALLKDAPVLLLDEATAAIDPLNEVAIQNALDTLRGRRTILVIAHRLQTVVGADQIAVLEDGRIAELGSHDELLGAGGRYVDFWNERSRAVGWRLVPSSPSPAG